MKNLRLPLEKKWFELTKCGAKTEDYREMTPYWYSRLCKYDGQKKSFNFWKFAPLSFGEFDSSLVSFIDFDQNIMTNGYPSHKETDRILTLEHKGIEIRTGNEAWGAVPGIKYFVIKHGNIINSNH